MSTWRNSAQANLEFFFLDDQSDEVQDESKKEAMFIGNEGNDFDDDTWHELFNSIRRVAVVTCTLAQPKDTDDWRRIMTFHTWTKIGDNNCKIIVDSGSCINTVSFSLVSKKELKMVPHPSPCKVAWVNATSMEVNERCLVHVQFATYKDKIWCNVISMDAGHVILGRPWLFDMDITWWGVQHLYLQPWKAIDQVDSKSTKIQTGREEVDWNTEGKEP